MGAKVVKQLQEEYGEELFGFYKALYIGTVVLDSPEVRADGDPVAEAVALTKGSQQIPRKVWVAVSSGAVRVMGRVTRDVLQTAPIPQIVFCGLDKDTQRRFAYISHDPSLRLTIANIFSVKEEARTLPKTVARAVTHYRKQEGIASSSGSPGAKRRKSKPGPTSPTAGPPTSPSGTSSANSSTTSSPAMLDKKKKRRSWGLLRKTSKLGLEAMEEVDGQILGTFQGKYISGISVTSVVGQSTVAEALNSLRQELAAMHKKKRAKKLAGDSVVLSVSSDGLRTADLLTGEIMQNVFIKDVAFTSTVRFDRKRIVFAYIAKDDRLKTLTCHVLDINKNMAATVCKAIAEAMQLYSKEYKGNKAFTPISHKEDITLSEALSKVHMERKGLKALKVLGSGQFGKVYLADQTKDFGNVVQRAVKLLRGGASEENKLLFMQEMEVMAHLHHENIVNLIGIAVAQRPWLAVLEFMQYGDLRAVLRAVKEKNFKLNIQEYLTIDFQICEALKYMAEKHYVHMDVALRNCLLHEKNLVKLADFGLTRRYDEGKKYHLLRKACKLPMKWLAPEGITKKRFGEPTDVWAFGVTAWESFSYGVYPYDGIANTEVQRRVKEGMRLEKPEDCPQEYFDIIFQCFNEDPAKRPTFKSLSNRIAAFQEKMRVGNPLARDIGQLLNAELSQDVRRMSMAAHNKRQPTIKRKASRRGKEVLEEVQDPRLPADILEARKISKQKRAGDEGSLFEATQMVLGDDLRVRLHSVSVAQATVLDNLADEEDDEENEGEDGGSAKSNGVTASPSRAGSRLRASASASSPSQRRRSIPVLDTAIEEDEEVEEQEASPTTPAPASEEPPPPSPLEAFRELRKSLTESVETGLGSGVLPDPAAPMDDEARTAAIDDEVLDGFGDDEGADDDNHTAADKAEAAAVTAPEEALPAPDATEAINGDATPAEDNSADERGATPESEQEPVPDEAAVVEDTQAASPAPAPVAEEPAVNGHSEHPDPAPAAEHAPAPAAKADLDPAPRPASTPRSKIFQALNPQRLYYESDEEKEGGQAKATMVVASGVGIRNYAELNAALDSESVVDEMTAMDDAYSRAADDSDYDWDEEEEEEEDFDPDALPDFGEMEKHFLAKRQQRSQAELVRREELREEHDKQAAAEAAVREEELTRINAIKQKEKEELERRKTEHMAAAMKRSSQLQFSFKWETSA